MTWFPVHCTSINNTNTLISGDNKGVAAQFLEGWAAADGNGTVGKEFVGAFGQANVGDTSPNVLGAFCQDTGMLCPPTARNSSCGTDSHPRQSSGGKADIVWQAREQSLTT